MPCKMYLAYLSHHQPLVHGTQHCDYMHDARDNMHRNALVCPCFHTQRSWHGAGIQIVQVVCQVVSVVCHLSHCMSPICSLHSD